MAGAEEIRVEGPTATHEKVATRRDFLVGVGAAGLLWAAPSLPLAAAPNSALDSAVNAHIKRLRRQGKVASDERTAWSVYDFTKRQKLVAINEDTPLQAASMIKPFIAQAYFFVVQTSGGKVRYTREDRKLLELMIRRSSNWATNRVIDLVSQHTGNRGPGDVERVLKRMAPGVFQETRIVERIPSGGRTYRNRASAHDYSRFLFAIWNDRLPYSGELRTLMSLTNGDRIARSVATIPSSVRVYHKTGSTAHLCGDMGIIEAHDRQGRPYPYTFIGIIEKQNRARSYSSWIAARGNVIRSVSDLVYRTLREHHQLV